MAALAGYATILKKSGTSTAHTDEAMTGSGAGPYTITDAAKAVWDRDVTPTFKDNGVAISTGDILSTDYLFGKVTFTGSKTGPITVATGNYMPMANAAGANSYTLSCQADVLDNTALDTDTGYRARLLGLLDVTVTVARFDPIDAVFRAVWLSRAPIVIDIQPGGTGAVARGWYVVENVDKSGDINALEAEDVTFQLDGDPEAQFAWSDA